jgi:hypothetical protein
MTRSYQWKSSETASGCTSDSPQPHSCFGLPGLVPSILLPQLLSSWLLDLFEFWGGLLWVSELIKRASFAAWSRAVAPFRLVCLYHSPQPGSALGYCCFNFLSCQFLALVIFQLCKHYKSCPNSHNVCITCQVFFCLMEQRTSNTGRIFVFMHIIVFW